MGKEGSWEDRKPGSWEVKKCLWYGMPFLVLSALRYIQETMEGKMRRREERRLRLSLREWCPTGLLFTPAAVTKEELKGRRIEFVSCQ